MYKPKSWTMGHEFCSMDQIPLPGYVRDRKPKRYIHEFAEENRQMMNDRVSSPPSVSIVVETKCSGTPSTKCKVFVLDGTIVTESLAEHDSDNPTPNRKSYQEKGEFPTSTTTATPPKIVSPSDKASIENDVTKKLIHDLSKALEYVQGTVAKKGQNPILSTVRIPKV